MQNCGFSIDLLNEGGVSSATEYPFYKFKPRNTLEAGDCVSRLLTDSLSHRELVLRRNTSQSDQTGNSCLLSLHAENDSVGEHESRGAGERGWNGAELGK